MKKILIWLLFALSFSFTARAQTITFVQEWTGGCTNCSSTTLTPSSSVTAGDLLIVYLSWGSQSYGAAAPLSTISDSVTNSLEVPWLTPINSGQETQQVGYFLAAHSGTLTYTITWTNNVQFPGVDISEWHASSGFWNFDSIAQAGVVGSSSVDTGGLTTSGSHELVLFANRIYDIGATMSSPKINGVTPTSLPSTDFYYSLFTSPQTAIHGTATYSTTTNWASALVAFNVTATASPISFVQQWMGSCSACSSLTATPSSSVTAGDLLVAFISWGQPGHTFYSVSSLSDGLLSFHLLTQLTPINSGTESAQVGYMLSARAGINAFTLTFAGSVQFPQLVISEWHLSSNVWAFDSSAIAGLTGSTAMDTGALTTTGTTELVFFGNRIFDMASNQVAPLIGAGLPVQLPQVFHYFLTFTAPATAIHGTATLLTSTNWAAALAGFYSTTAPVTKARPQVWIN